MTVPTRRSILRTAALAPLATACARRIPADRTVAVAAAVDGEVTIPLGLAPELGRAGGSVVVRPAGSAGAYLVANSGTGYLALRAECTHESCLVAWVPEDRQAECPCHGSRFAGDGALLNPPARADLDAYPAAPDGSGNVVVRLFAGDGVFGDHRVRDGVLTFPVSLFPALGTVGGAVLGRPEGFPGPLLVTRIAVDTVAALSAVCSHLGCTVLPAGAGLLCPCHASAFDLSGRFLKGPAGTGLLRYAASFDGTTVTVSTAPISG